MRTPSSQLTAILIGWSLLASSPAIAVPQTISGGLFDVTYDDAAVGLFGTPSIGGNQIFFTPPGFSAQSLNGAGTQQVTSAIGLRIIAKGGYRIASIDLLERGDYKLIGNAATADISGSFSATDISNPMNFVVDTLAVAPGTPLNLQTGLFATRPWEATASLAAAWLPGAPGVDVSIDNTLEATTTQGDLLAFIQAKFVGAPIVVTLEPATVVPAPASLLLLLGGLAVLRLHRPQRAV